MLSIDVKLKTAQLGAAYYERCLTYALNKDTLSSSNRVANYVTDLRKGKEHLSITKRISALVLEPEEVKELTSVSHQASTMLQGYFTANNIYSDGYRWVDEKGRVYRSEPLAASSDLNNWYPVIHYPSITQDTPTPYVYTPLYGWNLKEEEYARMNSDQFAYGPNIWDSVAIKSFLII